MSPFRVRTGVSVTVVTLISLTLTDCARPLRREATVQLALADTAVVFAPGIVSTGDVFASTFTPDGRIVVFTKFAPPRPLTLMMSTLVDGQWTTPTVLPFSGVYRDLDPAFAPDGARLYFSSGRPNGPSPADTTSGVDTWYVGRLNGGWSAPVRLAEPVSGPDADMFPSLTNRGVLYFDSFRSRPSRRLVYRAEPRVDGTLNEPEALPPTINADSGASNLFVDPDERYVVFGAVRPEGRGGVDLDISWKIPSGWTTPTNLGPTINTTGTEFCPFVSRDGRSLYFTRVSTLADKRVVRNVYVVRFDANRYRPDAVRGGGAQ
jgi:WD40-like Beta Propeller Repeat